MLKTPGASGCRFESGRSDLNAHRSLLIPAGVAAFRVAQVAALANCAGASLTTLQLFAVPLLDLFQFAGQFVPYFDDRITWRGYVARIGPNTVLVPLTKHAA